MAFMTSTPHLRSTSRLREVITAPYRNFMSLMMAMYSMILVTCPTLCVKIKGSINMDTLFGSMADVIIKIAFYVGALIAAGGVFSLVMAYKDDNGATRFAVKSCGA